MSDISELLDATEPVEIDYQSHKVTVHVYVMGRDRLVNEERQILASFVEGRDTSKPETYDDTIKWARSMVPIMVSHWDYDGSPMTRKGQPFPPTAENAALLPDLLVIEIADKAGEVWSKANPTNGDSSEATSEQPEQSSAEPSLTASTVA